MKKNSLTLKIFSIILAVVFVMALCSCGASSEAYDNAMSTTTSGSASGGTGKYEDFVVMEDAAEIEAVAPGATMESGSIVATGQTQPSLAEKIIYSANAFVETTEFDASVEQVYQMVEQCGGFMESSYISGAGYTSTYYNHQTYRSANFTIRVPAEQFAAVSGGLDALGYVTSLETYTDNITTQYYDTQSRLDAYEAEAERLIEMLAMADTVEEMIYIESRLSDVQYSIDSLTSRLKNWQNSVDYSTLYLYINEVAVIRVTPQVTETYWQQMLTGVKDSLTGIGEFFKDLFMWFVVSLPVLLLLAAVVVLIVFVVRFIIKRRDARLYGTPPYNSGIDPTSGDGKNNR